MKKIKNAKAPQICFCRWANKSYAVFNSLKKSIKIGVLTVTYSMITLVMQDLFAQPDSIIKSETVTLNEASVATTRQRIYSDIARIVTVIDKKEISGMPAVTLQDLLENVASIDVRKRGGEGVQADISIRGGTFDQILILLNGINITDPQTGHHNLDLPIDLASIDRIEILEGSGSRILGPNAFSGAINILTGQSNTNAIKAQVIAGDHKYFSPSISGNFNHKSISIHSAISHSQSDGYIYNTDFNINNYFLQGRYSSSSLGSFETQLSYQTKAYGSNGFYSPAYPNQFEQLKTQFYSLNWKKQFTNLTVESSAYWRRKYDKYELIRDSSRGRNYHRIDVPGAQVRFTYLSTVGKTIVGVSYRHEGIVSTSMGTPLEKPINVPNTDVQYINGSNRNTIDYFLDHTVYLSKISLSAGILGSWNSDYDNNIYTGFDLGYSLTSFSKIYGGVNQSLRLPTFTERFYKQAGYLGNSTISPEKALTYELGYKYNKSRWSTQLSFYLRQGKNIIDWVKLKEEDLWESKNLTKVHATGAETTVAYTPFKSWVKKMKISIAWQDLNKQSDNYISKYILDYLKLKINAGIDHAVFTPHLTAGWRLSYLDRVGTYNDFKTGKETPYGSFCLVDLRLSYRAKYFNIFTEADNIFNKKYVDIANLEQAGRWLKFGLQIGVGE